MTRLLPHPFGRFFPPLRIAPHVIDVYRNVPIRGDAGDVTPRPVPVFFALRAWVQAQTPEEQIQSARLGLVYSHKIVLWQNPGVANGDFVRWVDTVSQVVRTLNVLSVNQPLGVGLSWTLTAQEKR